MHATPLFQRTAHHLSAFGLALALGSAAVGAATPDPIAERHAQEVAACSNGQTKQTRAACLDEARSAYAAARKGLLQTDPAAERANRTERCEVLQGSDHKACLARMRGRGTTSGTPADGGVYRELVTVVPAAPAASAAETTAGTPVPR